MTRVEDVEQLLSDVSQTLLCATGSRPGQHNYDSSFHAGGEFVLVQVDGVWNAGGHNHGYNEYCLVLKDRITTRIGGEVIVSKSGDLFFKPAKVLHRAWIEGPCVG